MQIHPGLRSADSDRAAVADIAAPISGAAGGALEAPYPPYLRPLCGPGANCECVALAAGCSYDTVWAEEPIRDAVEVPHNAALRVNGRAGPGAGMPR